jgi:hypothetical protein
VRAHAVRPARLSHRGACAARVRSKTDGERRKVSREDDQRARLAIEREMMAGLVGPAGGLRAKQSRPAGQKLDGLVVSWVSKNRVPFIQSRFYL